MAASATRWNLLVDAGTDAEVREFLAEKGAGCDLSKFVEDAVRDKLFRAAVQRGREANVDISADEAEELAEESVAWARKQTR